MLILVNKRRLMGDMKNRGWQNVIAVSFLAAIMIALTIAMLWDSILG